MEGIRFAMNNKKNNIPNGRETLNKGTQLLVSFGLDNQTAWLEANLLLGKACGKDRIKLLTTLDDPLEEYAFDEYMVYIERRLSSEPLQYIMGEQVFMSLYFKVTPAVLIPRAETELLVNEVIEMKRPKANILDLCTGSGAIAVSLAHYMPDCQIVAVDISADALEVAEENAAINSVGDRIEFFCGDMFSPLASSSSFEIIICNPPYINAVEYHELPADVKKEPRLALYGGTDGLDFYRLIGAKAKQFMSQKGVLLVEIGWQQGTEVKEIFEGNGFNEVKIIKDWNGHDRIVTCTV